MRKEVEMRRMLVIGSPFVGRSGGDASRAQMEARTLVHRFQVDHLILIQSDADAASVRASHGKDPIEMLRYRPGRGLRPAGACGFDQEQLKRFHNLLRDRNYAVIFFRYVSGTRLVREVEKVLPSSHIIIDADMLASRIAIQAWQQKRSIGNRFFLFESWKLRRYERGLFNKPYLFLMSNCDELVWVREQYLRPDAPARFALMPNTMPEVSSTVTKKRETGTSEYVLFHGVLQSTVNSDALRFIVEEIYPLIHEALQQHDIRIHVVGRGLSHVHHKLLQQHECPRITLVGEVQDIGQTVSDSLFCIVPLRIGSGTKTRILEAAAYGKAVITTPIGGEGLRFSENEIVVRETAVDLAHALIFLLENRGVIRDLGESIRARSLELYSEQTVACQLLQAIEDYLSFSH